MRIKIEKEVNIFFKKPIFTSISTLLNTQITIANKRKFKLKTPHLETTSTSSDISPIRYGNTNTFCKQIHLNRFIANDTWRSPYLKLYTHIAFLVTLRNARMNHRKNCKYCAISKLRFLRHWNFITRKIL